MKNYLLVIAFLLSVGASSQVLEYNMNSVVNHPITDAQKKQRALDLISNTFEKAENENISTGKTGSFKKDKIRIKEEKITKKLDSIHFIKKESKKEIKKMEYQRDTLFQPSILNHLKIKKATIIVFDSKTSYCFTKLFG